MKNKKRQFFNLKCPPNCILCFLWWSSCCTTCVAQLVPMHPAATIWRMRVSLQSKACLYMGARFGSNTPRSMQSILQCVLSCLKSRLSICEQHQLSPHSQSRRMHPNLRSNQPSFQYSSRAPSARGMQNDAS